MMANLEEIKANIWQAIGSLVFLVSMWALIALVWLATP